MSKTATSTKSSGHRLTKKKRSLIDTLYVKLLRDPSTNVIIGIISVVFIIWLVIPLILILSGAFYIPTAGQTFSFKGELTAQGQETTPYAFSLNTSSRIKKITVFMNEPKGADFSLILWDNQGRRTGGEDINSSASAEIPNSKYSAGVNSKSIVIKMPDLPDSELVTWYVAVYSNKGSGKFFVNIATHLVESAIVSFHAFTNVFTNPTFFNPSGDSSTSFFSKDVGLEFGGFSRAIIYSNNTVYNVEGYEGIEVLNVTNTSNIQEIVQFKFENIFTTDIALQNNLLYASDSKQGLVVMNTTNKEEGLSLISITPLHINKTEFIEVSGNYAYMDYQDDGFLILNISDPYHPSIIGNATVAHDSDDIAISGNHAFLVGSDTKLMIFDISNHSSPQVVSHITSLNDVVLNAKQIKIYKNYAYLSLGTNGLAVLDISNPLNISLVNHYNLQVDSLSIFNDIAFISSKKGDFNALIALNITDPLNIEELSSLSVGITGINDVAYDAVSQCVIAAHGGNGVLFVNAAELNNLSKISEYQDNILITTYHFVGVSRGNVLNTLLLGLITTLISVLLGTSLAFILARYEFPGKRVFSLLSLAPLIIPPFISGMGFRYFLGPSGLLNNFLLIPTFHARLVIEGFVAICFVQSFHFYALVYLNAFSSFVNVDPSMEEQAENLGASNIKLFFTVTLPLALPGIAAGAILVLILSMEDVGTPIIFVGMGDNFARQFLTYYIFSSYQLAGSNIITPEVCVLGGILLVIAIVGFLIIRKYVSLRQYAMVSKGRAGKYRLSKAKWKLLFIYPYLIVLFALSLLVHIGITLMSLSKTLGVSDPRNLHFTFENYTYIFTSSQYDIPPYVKNTLVYSLAATVLIVIMGSFAAYVVSRKEFKGKALFDSLVTIPIAIPGIVLALGYYRTFDWGTIFTNNPNSFTWFMNDLTIGLRLNPFVGIAYVLLIISYTIRKFPFTVRAAYAGLQQTDKVLEESSFNLGAGRMKTFAKITVPMISLNVFAGSLVSFLYCLSEVSTTIFIIGSAKGGTLTWMMANQVNAKFQIFCALGVILMILQIISLFVTNVILGSRTEAITGI